MSHNIGESNASMLSRLPNKSAELDDTPCASAQSAATITFLRHLTGLAMRQAALLQPNASTCSNMYNALKCSQRSGGSLHKEHHGHTAELQLVFVKIPQLCNRCDSEEQGPMCTDLGCPVLNRQLEDDLTSSLWPLERLAPCKS